jgi:transposase
MYFGGVSMRKKRRSFSKEFKVEAVELVIKGSHNISKIARDLGVRDTVLGRWVKEYEQSQASAFPGSGHLKPEEAELVRLRRENELLRMERDILKKAAAIFSKDSL